MALSNPQGAADLLPALLTVEEAAAIARCSIKTVRRAYTNGSLTAYRRRGSRAILLDPEDVRTWARGELLSPAHLRLDSSRCDRPAHSSASPRRHAPAANLAAQLRFDLSTRSLRARRSSQSDAVS
jgi:excisionase family DNA binding protein